MRVRAASSTRKQAGRFWWAMTRVLRLRNSSRAWRAHWGAAQGCGRFRFPGCGWPDGSPGARKKSGGSSAAWPWTRRSRARGSAGSLHSAYRRGLPRPHYGIAPFVADRISYILALQVSRPLVTPEFESVRYRTELLATRGDNRDDRCGILYNSLRKWTMTD